MDWKPKVTCMEVDVDACTGPGLPSMVHSRGAEREHRQQGTGGVGKKWQGLRLTSPNLEGLRCGKLGQ